MTPSLKEQSYSIVCLGQFAPAIFHPSWFKVTSLLGDTEVEAALKRPMVVQQEATMFSTDWLTVEVQPNKLQLRTTQAPFSEAIRDLMISILKLFSQTPITAIGINRNDQFQVETSEEWHRRGNQWAPKEMWNTILSHPGTRALVVEGKRTDKFEGYIWVTLQPVSPLSFSIDINDHFQIPVNGDKASAVFARELIESQWIECQERAENIVKVIINS